MPYHILAALRPFSARFVDGPGTLHAAFPTEPSALFIYVLVLLSFWAVWKGDHASGRAGGPAEDGGDPDPEGASGGEAPEGSAVERRTSRTRGRSRKRKREGKTRPPGHVTWVQ